ncbi:MAG: hypothetical protein JSV64_07755 [Candidatus Bathyarchaeota archaeon]|nr:MAG: hypothetical protein JSV64_07755 [Candidatus Bathyarchaeota archaeon]
MAIAREQIAPAMTQRATQEVKPLNAQQVTSIAFTFLKSLGHKRGIKPKRVFVENQRYAVEAEIGKQLVAKVQVDMITSEIKEYSIEKKAEEAPVSLPVEPKAMLLMFSISVLVSLTFAALDVGAFLASFF